jgi:hypothetical protein
MMGELLQILSAAKSMQDQESLQGIVNQHAEIINAQQVQIQTLQRDLTQTIDAHNGALKFQLTTASGTVLILLIAVGIGYSVMDRKIRKLQAQLNPIPTGHAA